MISAFVEPSLTHTVHHANTARVVMALVLSIAVHAAVITWTPILRPKVIEPPPTITVELIPQAEPAAKIEPAPPPPTPEVNPEPQPEPIAEPPPEPVAEMAPEPKPKPKPRPEPKPVRKKPAPIKAPPPEPKPEIASAPTPPPVAPPPAPETPPTFSTPAEAPPPAAIPSELLKPQAQPFDNDLLDGYAQLLSGAIGKFQKYPRLAQMRGWEGTVEVLLKIAAGGAVRDITLIKSSGFEVLDEQALAMVKQATPLPKPPSDLNAQDFSVRVPIVFRLQK